MDHYTAEAYEQVRLKIVENIDRLEAYRNKHPGQKPGSGDIHNLKNWKRFGAAFAWDPEVYVDIMKNPGMSDAELMSSLRKTETNLMKKWAVVDKMPMHHKIALRTGGDLGLRTPVHIWMETRQRLYDRFGFNPGNGPANLNATSQFNEGIHLERQNAAGSPLRKTEVPSPVLKQIKKDNVGLHRAGQKLGELPALYEPLIGASSKEQAAYLEEFIIGQIDRFEDATNYPRTRQQNETINDGLSWFLSDESGNKIDAFSEKQRIKDQPVLKAFNEAVEYKDPRTGELFTLDELGGKGFVGTGKISPAAEDLTLNFNSRKGKKAAKAFQSHGGMRFLPYMGIGLAVPTILGNIGKAADAYKTGDFKTGNLELANAGAETLGAAIGEIPIAGDVIVESFTGSGVGDGTINGLAQRQQEFENRQNTVAAQTVNKLSSDPLNELEFAAKNPGEVIKNIYENDNVQRGLKLFGAGMRYAGGLRIGI